MSLLAIRCINCGAPTGGVIANELYNNLDASKKVCNSCIGTVDEGWVCPGCDAVQPEIYCRENSIHFRSANLDSGVILVGEEYDASDQDNVFYCRECDYQLRAGDDYEDYEYG